MDKPNFAAMTPEQRRDWLAAQNNFRIVPNTLDAAAEAMPEGWMWSRYPDHWEADCFPSWNPESRKPPEKTLRIPDTGNEINDRFWLACECVWAEKERS